MIGHILKLEGITELSIGHLKAINGGEEETFCTDDRRDFMLGCTNF